MKTYQSTYQQSIAFYFSLTFCLELIGGVLCDVTSCVLLLNAEKFYLKHGPLRSSAFVFWGIF